jgi:hypothetical protein
VRVNNRIEKLAMADGHGELPLPPHALVTIDPNSRVLRQQDYIDAWKAIEDKKKAKNETNPSLMLLAARCQHAAQIRLARLPQQRRALRRTFPRQAGQHKHAASSSTNWTSA